MDDFAHSKVELARRLGIDRTTLYTHWEDPGRPEPEADGGYAIAQFRAWGIENGFVLADDNETEFSPAAMNRLRCKNLALSNELKKFQIDELKKNYVSLEEHFQELSAVVEITKGVVEDIPRQIALLTTDTAIRHRVQEVCDHAQKLFHEKFDEARKKAGMP